MGEMVEYPSRDHTGTGYLAPPRSGRGPGVIVIQEWWGLVPHIKDVCDRFAAEGFTALAPDLYHGATTTEPDEAGKLVMELEIEHAADDIVAAVDWLVAGDHTAGGAVGIVGFCMGGAVALYAATKSPKLAAVVPFYPVLGLRKEVHELDASKLRGAVLAHFATEDHAYTQEQVENFERRLREAGVDIEVVWYQGADHAFFNDGRPEVHRPDDSQLAWDRTLAFFRKHLATTAAPVG